MTAPRTRAARKPSLHPDDKRRVARARELADLAKQVGGLYDIAEQIHGKALPGDQAAAFAAGVLTVQIENLLEVIAGIAEVPR